MQEYAKLFLLLIFCSLIYFGLFLISNSLHPVLLAVVAVLISLFVITGVVAYIWRRKKTNNKEFPEN